MLLNLIVQNLTAQSLVQAASSSVVDISRSGVIAVQVNATVSTPSEKIFASTAVDTDADTITIASHGLLTGTKFQLTTTGSLPAGLSLATDYFVIAFSANAIKVASSLANANAGTAIDITTQGSGNDTLTPVALAGATAKLQQSINGTDWFDLGSAQNITTTSKLLFSQENPPSKYVKVTYAITAGQLTVSEEFLGKGLV